MPITFTASSEIPQDADAVVAILGTGRELLRGPEDVDVAYLEARGFEGKPGEVQVLPSARGSIIAVGIGEQPRLTLAGTRKAVGAALRAGWRSQRIAIPLPDVPGTAPRQVASALAEAASLATYQFTTYKSESKPSKTETVVVVADDTTEVDHGVRRGARVAEAVALARTLVNEPPGAMTPRRLAEVATEVAEREGIDIEVLDENAIERERLGGLLGVARGSAEPPRLIRMTYEPPDPIATVALIGKGITFDSGGLSIKPADGMMTMKTDMSGAAAVLATMSLLPDIAPRVKVIGIMPTTENMPGGRATKPGDVLKIRNGKTVEVLNTDAEGRLVLADGLSLAVEDQVDAIIDVATLTGACMVALGKEIAGLMGTNDDLIAQVRAAAERAGEAVWHLPLPEEYRRQIDSDIADLKNIGDGGQAGALTAGLFLKEFTDKTPWVHLDIAGPARSDKDEGAVSKGGTGFGVRTMAEFLSTFTTPRAN